MLKTVRVPLARASVVWIIGEYREKIPELAPDALRTLARGFPSEVCYFRFADCVSYCRDRQAVE